LIKLMLTSLPGFLEPMRTMHYLHFPAIAPIIAAIDARRNGVPPRLQSARLDVQLRLRARCSGAQPSPWPARIDRVGPGLPLRIIMFDSLPAVTTLMRTA